MWKGAATLNRSVREGQRSQRPKRTKKAILLFVGILPVKREKQVSKS